MNDKSVTLDNLLLNLTKNILTDSQIESVFKSFKELHSQQERPTYSIVTTLVLTDKGEQDTEILELNLRKLYDFCIENNENKLSNYVYKIIDHINLAKQQKEYIEKVIRVMADSINKLNKEANTLKKLSNQTYNQLRKIQDIKSKIYTEFVSVLGIFTTIVFACFGGLEMLKNVLGNITSVRTAKLLVFSSLTFSGIILLLFLLLNVIARMNGLTLRSCGCDLNKKCEHNLFQKYPYIVLPFLVLLYVFLIGIIAYIFNYHAILEKHIYKMNEIAQLIIIFGILFIPILIFRLISRKNNSN